MHRRSWPCKPQSPPDTRQTRTGKSAVPTSSQSRREFSQLDCRRCSAQAATLSPANGDTDSTEESSIFAGGGSRPANPGVKPHHPWITVEWGPGCRANTPCVSGSVEPVRAVRAARISVYTKMTARDTGMAGYRARKFSWRATAARLSRANHPDEPKHDGPRVYARERWPLYSRPIG